MGVGGSFDVVSEKVKRAAQLIKICKTKLTQTQEDVNQVLMELNEGDKIE